MTHEMKLAAEPFEKILQGKKTIESRLYDEKRRRIAIGDQITFGRNDSAAEPVTCLVVALHVYPSFELMMHDLPASRFGWELPEQAIQEINQFYSADDQEKFGVVGIQIKLS